MKGNPSVIAVLNDVLKAELTAINQYFLHAEMCENWGYHRLGEHIRHESIDEMRHGATSDGSILSHPVEVGPQGRLRKAAWRCVTSKAAPSSP